MPWIRFTDDFDWHVKPNVTIAYKAGNEYLVKQEVADTAVESGKGVKIPRRKAGDDASR